MDLVLESYWELVLAEKCLNLEDSCVTRDSLVPMIFSSFVMKFGRNFGTRCRISALSVVLGL